VLFRSRTDFNPPELLALAESIAAQGILNPPLVARNGSGYVLLAGERRWRARLLLAIVATGLDDNLLAAVDRMITWGPARLAQIAGLTDVPITARLAEGEEAELHAAAVVDNHQRANLNPIEEARDFAALRERHGLSIWHLSRLIGRSDAHIRNRLLLLGLEPEIQRLVAAGRLSRDAAVTEALLSVPDPAIRLKLAQRYAERGSTIRAIVAGCQQVVELLAKTAEQAKAAEQAKTVPVRAVPAAAPRPAVDATGPGLCLCDDCREQIDHLAEELCGRCAARGLTAECLTCPGVIEFINRLVRRD